MTVRRRTLQRPETTEVQRERPYVICGMASLAALQHFLRTSQTELLFRHPLAESSGAQRK